MFEVSGVQCSFVFSGCDVDFDSCCLLESDEEMSAVETPLAKSIDIEPMEDPEPEPEEIPESEELGLSPPSFPRAPRFQFPVERSNDHDLARLQRALGSSPPRREQPPSAPLSRQDAQGQAEPSEPSSPVLSPVKQELPTFEISTLSTPPRKSPSSSFATSKVEFQTPSPPKGGLPDLPGPPSEDEDVDVERTPVRPKGRQGQDPQQLEFSTLKTPAVPGGWLRTPAPARGVDDSDIRPEPSKNARRRSNSDSKVEDSSGEGNPLAATATTGDRTPFSALNRANSLPSRTPALPGAWVNTPGTLVRRRSLLKVRFEEAAPAPTLTSDSAPSDTEGILPRVKFDVEGSESSLAGDGLELVPGPGPAVVTEIDVEGGETPSFEGVQESSPSPAKVETKLPPEEENGVLETAKSPSRPLASPFRVKREPANGSVRMVDEFGEERGMKEEKQPQSGSPLRRDISVSMRMPGGTLQTPRHKSVVRILDAMGREVEEESPGKADESEDTITSGYESPADRAAALERVKKVAADLKIGLGEAQRYVLCIFTRGAVLLIIFLLLG